MPGMGTLCAYPRRFRSRHPRHTSSRATAIGVPLLGGPADCVLPIAYVSGATTSARPPIRFSGIGIAGFGIAVLNQQPAQPIVLCRLTIAGQTRAHRPWCK
jgi:hypothetical protein